MGCGPATADRSVHAPSRATADSSASASPPIGTPSAAGRTTSPTGAQTPTPAPTSRAADVDTMLSRIVAAVGNRSRIGFDAMLSERDPGFSNTAEMIFDNLAAIRPGDFQVLAA